MTILELISEFKTKIASIDDEEKALREENNEHNNSVKELTKERSICENQLLQYKSTIDDYSTLDEDLKRVSNKYTKARYLLVAVFIFLFFIVLYITMKWPTTISNFDKFVFIAEICASFYVTWFGCYTTESLQKRYAELQELDDKRNNDIGLDQLRGLKNLYKEKIKDITSKITEIQKKIITNKNRIRDLEKESMEYKEVLRSLELQAQRVCENATLTDEELENALNEIMSVSEEGPKLTRQQKNLII